MICLKIINIFQSWNVINVIFNNLKLIIVFTQEFSL